jgi:hypothetical protein
MGVIQKIITFTTELFEPTAKRSKPAYPARFHSITHSAFSLNQNRAFWRVV